MTTLLIVTWMLGLAQGPHPGLVVFTDPYCMDHEANPTAFLGLCSLICSMSFLWNRDEAPTLTHTPCLMRFSVHKSIQVRPWSVRPVISRCIGKVAGGRGEVRGQTVLCVYSLVQSVCVCGSPGPADTGTIQSSVPEEARCQRRRNWRLPI